MSGGIVAAVLAAAGLAFILAPLFRADAAEAERTSRRRSEREEFVSRREMLFATLRDLEDDHDTGKITAADFETQRDRLTAETAAVLERLDALEEARESGKLRSIAAPRPDGGSGRTS